jgi:hypothetical protein
MKAQTGYPPSFNDYVSQTDEAQIRNLRDQGVPIEDIVGLGETNDDDDAIALQELGGIP